MKTIILLLLLVSFVSCVPEEPLQYCIDDFVIVNNDPNKVYEIRQISEFTASLAKEKGFPQDEFSVQTQTMLQTWLRNEYHLHIRMAALGLKMWSFIIEQLTIDGTQFKGGDLGMKNYKSYEEALEIGLQQTLSLIKDYDNDFSSEF